MVTTPSSKEPLYRRVQNDFIYHPPETDEKIRAYTSNRAVLLDAARVLITGCPEGRELSLALTKLEEAMFWANAAIARSE